MGADLERSKKANAGLEVELSAAHNTLTTTNSELDSAVWNRDALKVELSQEDRALVGMWGKLECYEQAVEDMECELLEERNAAIAVKKAALGSDIQLIEECRAVATSEAKLKHTQ